jgi:hypothetical protein
MFKAGWQASNSNIPHGNQWGCNAPECNRTNLCLKRVCIMASEVYVVHHHGAWRTRIDGKHCGEYPSREAAVRSAIARAEKTGQDTRVFSQGIICQFHLEWHSGGQPNSPSV